MAGPRPTAPLGGRAMHELPLLGAGAAAPARRTLYGGRPATVHTRPLPGSRDMPSHLPAGCPGHAPKT